MTKEEGKSYLLLYGSQTGQAKAIAEEIAERSNSFGLHARLFCFSMTEKKFWLDRENVAVLISSTTGDGEPPDTVTKFFRRIHKKTLAYDHFSTLNYCFLGLGDSNYSNFCNCGKSIDKRLSQLGAKRLYESGFADDATGLEVVVDPWIDGLLPALQKFLGVDQESVKEPSSNPSGNATEIQKATNSHEIDQNISQNRNNNSENINDSLSKSDANKAENLLAIESKEDLNKIAENTNDFAREKTYDLETTNVNADSTKGTGIYPASINHKGDFNAVISTKVLDNFSDLVKPCESLSEMNLSVPILPAGFIKVQYLREQQLDIESIPFQNGCSFPSCDSVVTRVPVVTMTQLTSHDAVKKTLSMELDISECSWSYEPGDAIGILCPNDSKDVDYIIHRLGLEKLADTTCSLSVLENTKKKNPKIPAHYPQICTARFLLTNCCDLRSVPKKAFLRALVEYTTDGRDNRRLQELCSKQGAEEFHTYVRVPSVNIIDILMAFSSCRPTIELLLEQLPRLLPRPYSASSSALATPGILQCVFNVVEIPAGNGRGCAKQGVCTGWLNRIGEKLAIKKLEDEKITANELQLNSLTLQDQEQLCFKIPIFLRSNQHFRAPEDLRVPYIMIGPGTGVAPFIGFLKQRQCVLGTNKGTEKGEVWLFYGCRHQKRDFLFRKELENFTASRVLNRCIVSFSRDNQATSDSGINSKSTTPFYINPAGKYVQDNLKLFQKDIISLIFEHHASVYVCGDAKGMAKNVGQAFIDILQENKDMTPKDASDYIMNMRIQKKYLEDVWT